METGIQQCKITIIAGRKRLADPDNICCKFILDSIKGEGGFIQDDNAGVITSFVVQQVKVGKKHKEKEPFTDIIIEWE
jgi:hypothetical protein